MKEVKKTQIDYSNFNAKTAYNKTILSQPVESSDKYVNKLKSRGWMKPNTLHMSTKRICFLSKRYLLPMIHEP